ncbi:hypothetical protein [Streptomyces sp. UH6]|uniref:hypothetical protein n=1 Tax=Streptomyces sp. UH6 TaxID=2748379 RepID=UPI0015D50FA8|nr:hypothetical protein [Streptomyces sp. UH6]NYV73489.1 hypothetical protein [Streptomyces sp. UH6]
MRHGTQQLAARTTVLDDEDLVLGFDTEAGQDALADIVADLERDADTDVDAEDLAHYRSLLTADVVRLPRRVPAVWQRAA